MFGAARGLLHRTKSPTRWGHERYLDQHMMLKLTNARRNQHERQNDKLNRKTIDEIQGKVISLTRSQQNCWGFPIHSMLDLQSLHHSVHQQRQALQNTSFASCKFRRDGDRRTLQISWVGLDCELGLGWRGSSIIPGNSDTTTYGLCSVGLTNSGVEEETMGWREVRGVRDCAMHDHRSHLNNDSNRASAGHYR